MKFSSVASFGIDLIEMIKFEDYSYVYAESPELFPCIRKNMNDSYAWIHYHIYKFLWIIFLLISFINSFYTVSLWFNENVFRLWLFPYCNNALVNFFRPFKVRVYIIIVLIERTSNNKALENFKKQLFSLVIVEN